MFNTERVARRLKRLVWKLWRPDWVDNHGIRLPVKHPLVSPGIAKEIYLGSYEAKEIEIISKRLSADDIVLEVGSGLGFLSAYCAKHIGSSRVFTYEANPDLIPVIAATHEQNGVSPTVINALLGRGEGTRKFHLERDFWASSAHRDGGQTITVRQIDLCSELARIKPSFLIVDIEGGELEFFSEADLSSVRKICVETHPDVLGDYSLSTMFVTLITKGFSLDFSIIRKNVFFLYRSA